MITKEQALKLARELGLQHGFDELDWVIDSDQLHALCQRVEEMARKQALTEAASIYGTPWAAAEKIYALITNQKEGT